MMSRDPKTLTIPDELAAFLKRPPLLVTEDPAEYDAVFDSVAQTIIPVDRLEWLGVGRYVDFVWEAKRLRRAKAGIVNTTYREALFRVLETILPETDRSEVAARLVEDWFEKPAERKSVIDLLAKYGLDPESACAEAMALRAPELEKFDRMMQQLEVAGMSQLREIEFHRRASSWRAPNRLKEIVDGTAVEPFQLPKPDEATHVGPAQ
jgi:hypothetical protein